MENFTSLTEQMRLTCKALMESAADEFGISTATLGKYVGQGGAFYQRLCDPAKSVHPRTADELPGKIAQLRAARSK